MARGVARAVLLAGLSVATASASGPVPVDVNLDGDPALERVAAPLLDNGVYRRVAIIDRCAGRRIRHWISPAWDSVDLAVRNLDWFTRRPEILVDVRSGGGGRAGVLKVVRFAGVSRVTCPSPRALLRYSPDRPILAPPVGYAPANFELRARDYSIRYRGQELRLCENYVKAGEPLCCGSKQRVTFFHFSSLADRYVAFRTRVTSVSYR